MLEIRYCPKKRSPWIIMLMFLGLITAGVIGEFEATLRGILLAAIVGVSLFFTLSISTMVGATVPLLINKLKIDPAVASGPFITTINDIMGLIIYFSIATAFLEYLPK